MTSCLCQTSDSQAWILPRSHLQFTVERIPLRTNDCAVPRGRESGRENPFLLTTQTPEQSVSGYMSCACLVMLQCEYWRLGAARWRGRREGLRWLVVGGLQAHKIRVRCIRGSVGHYGAVTLLDPSHENVCQPFSRYLSFLQTQKSISKQASSNKHPCHGRSKRNPSWRPGLRRGSDSPWKGRRRA